MGSNDGVSSRTRPRGRSSLPRRRERRHRDRRPRVLLLRKGESSGAVCEIGGPGTPSVQGAVRKIKQNDVQKLGWQLHCHHLRTRGHRAESFRLRHVRVDPLEGADGEVRRVQADPVQHDGAHLLRHRLTSAETFWLTHALRNTPVSTNPSLFPTPYNQYKFSNLLHASRCVAWNIYRLFAMWTFSSKTIYQLLQEHLCNFFPFSVKYFLKSSVVSPPPTIQAFRRFLPLAEFAQVFSRSAGKNSIRTKSGELNFALGEDEECSECMHEK